MFSSYPLRRNAKPIEMARVRCRLVGQVVVLHGLGVPRRRRHARRAARLLTTHVPLLACVSTIAVDDHDTGPGHPERADRLVAAMAGLRDAELGDALPQVVPRAATPTEVERVRRPRTCARGGEIRGVRWRSPRSRHRGLPRVVGHRVLAVDQASRCSTHCVRVTWAPAWCSHDRRATTRSVDVWPGFLPDQQRRGRRREHSRPTANVVLIVDWDVHHGNGTQDIFWDDPRCALRVDAPVSCLPGNGARGNETGGDERGRGSPSISRSHQVRPATSRGGARPRCVAGRRRFSPTWVLVSAGFDAHVADPLAGPPVDRGRLRRAQCSGSGRSRPDRAGCSLFLEGGDDLVALRECVRVTATVLVGGRTETEAASSGVTGTRSGGAGRARRALARAQRPELPRASGLPAEERE